MDGMGRTVAQGGRRCIAENQHLYLRVFECPAACAPACRSQSGDDASVEHEWLKVCPRLIAATRPARAVAVTGHNRSFRESA